MVHTGHVVLRENGGTLMATCYQIEIAPRKICVRYGVDGVEHRSDHPAVVAFFSCLARSLREIDP